MASVRVATCRGVGTTSISGRTPRPSSGLGQAVSIRKCGSCSTRCVAGSSSSEMVPPLQPASAPPVSWPMTVMRRCARRLAVKLDAAENVPPSTSTTTLPRK
uniref:Uncharacterized protein n=1 Tax=Tanacetum cinerariifolium TaxID=118510 RepID=A0A699V4W5_TANCI|nr:hypothetical protein [Tanacetum cinerariifolium]